MNQNSIVLYILFYSFFVSCTILDIRSKDFIKTGKEDSNQNKGKLILEKLINKYGGLKRFNSFRSAEVIYEDHWDAFIPKIYNSPYEDDMPVKYSFLLGTFNSQVTFLSGEKKGKKWGIQNWATYKINLNKKAIFKKHFKTKFHLPTRQFFFELPFNLQNFSFISYMGEEKLNGRLYSKIFLSNSFDVNKKNDQFIAYINVKTFELDLIYYTIREMGRVFYGANHFSDFKIINGIKLPMKSIIRWEPFGEKIVHQFKVNSIKFLTKEETHKELYFPDPFKSANYFDYF